MLLDPVTCGMCNGDSWYMDENGDDVDCIACAATGQVESTYLTLIGHQVKVIFDHTTLSGTLAYDATHDSYFITQFATSSNFFRHQIVSIDKPTITVKGHP